jgi:hypothetical protein
LTIDILFIISTVLLVLSAAAKGILHVYLDVKNGHKVTFARSKGYVYLLPYSENVSSEYEGTKALCNKIHWAVVFFLIAFLIIFLFRLILGRG